MPLVFVHGVNVRLGEVYSREQAFRDRHFVEIFYKQLGREVGMDSILNPYWGDLGASVSPDTPFLPRGSYQMLWRRQAQNSANEHKMTEMEGRLDSDSPTPLLDMARTASISDVIDVLWDLVDQEMREEGGGNSQSDEEMARLAQRALNFCNSEEGEKWLATVTSDDQILEKLANLLNSSRKGSGENANGTKALTKLIKSGGARFKQAFAEARNGLSTRSKSVRTRINEDVLNARLRLRQKAVGTTAKLFNDPLRVVFHQQCALLIGDAFAYFSARNEQKAAPMA